MEPFDGELGGEERDQGDAAALIVRVGRVEERPDEGFEAGVLGAGAKFPRSHFGRRWGGSVADGGAEGGKQLEWIGNGFFAKGPEGGGERGVEVDGAKFKV